MPTPSLEAEETSELGRSDASGVASAGSAFRARLIAALLLAFAVALLAAQHLWSSPSEDVGRTSRVERRDIESVVSVAGTIEPAREAELYSQVPGIVVQLGAAEGDHVEAGQGLIQLDESSVLARLREAEARRAGVRVELGLGHHELERNQALYEKGMASESKLQEATARQKRLGMQLEELGAAIELLKVEQERTRIRSPIAGTLLSLRVDVGDLISPLVGPTPGASLATVADLGDLRLRALADENALRELREGMPVRMFTDSFGDKQSFAGRVDRVALEGTRVQNVTYFEIQISVEDPESERLRPRMSAQAEVVTAHLVGATCVPDVAVRYDGAESYVQVVHRDGKTRIERRKVEVATVSEGMAALSAGVDPGEEVLLP